MPVVELSDIAVFVPIEAIWPELRSDEATLLGLLGSLSRDDTLFWCARVNTIVTGHGTPDVKARQQRVLNLLLTSEEINKINVFSQGYGGAKRVMVFFRGQMLELIRWAAKHCTNHPADGETFSDAGTRSRFVQAALIAGSLWSQRTHGDRLSLEGGIEDARQRALGAFRKGMEEFDLAPHLGITLGRGWSLFSQRFASRYPAFEAQFSSSTGLTVEQYFICVTGLGMHTCLDTPSGPIFLNHRVGPVTVPYQNVFATYLALESQTPEQLADSLWSNPAVPYRSIRERPILVVEDGRSIILDPTSYSEKISVGPLFHLVASNNNSRSRVNDLFSAFGLAFEDYAIDILKRMYPPVLVQRLYWNVKGKDATSRDFEIDAVLNDGAEVVIFEMKAAWIREDKILDGSHEDFLEHLRLKYGVSSVSDDGSSQERPKGVAQLARIVTPIVRGDWRSTDTEFSSATLIYPVLVVHDTRMDAPAYGDFLEAEFRSLLTATSPKIRVAPLTVMTIRELESLESSVDRVALRQLLEDYTRACPDRVRSLHNYIAYSEYVDKMKPSNELINISSDLIIHAQRELFPPTVDEPPLCSS